MRAALAYASAGIAVFPLGPRSKQPLIAAAKGGHGLHDATTDLDQIRGWWTTHPTANIGLRTGVVFDVIDLSEDAVDAPGEARAGTRNDHLNRTAFALGQLVGTGALDEQETVEALTVAGLSLGLDIRESSEESPAAFVRELSSRGSAGDRSVIQPGPGLQQFPILAGLHDMELGDPLDELGVLWKPLLHRHEGIAAEIEGVLQENPMLPTDHAKPAVAELLAPRWDLRAGRLDQSSVADVVDPLRVIPPARGLQPPEGSTRSPRTRTWRAR